jgi:hypothetical protein
VRRSLVILGLLLCCAGLLWPWLSKLPLGRLPGDLIIDKPGFKLFIPLTTMLLVSGLLSLLAWLFRR